jgi:Kef-type K+ transport system membrane component KefB
MDSSYRRVQSGDDKEREQVSTMEPVFLHLLILMAVAWTTAMMLRRIGVPIIMGELLVGVILGPAVLGWVEMDEIIEILAEMGIFFVMLHAGVKTDAGRFFDSARHAVGVAVVGAIVPFSLAMSIALAFGLSTQQSAFVGLTMTATAVIITITVLEDLKMLETEVARVVIAACVLDDLITLVFLGLVIGVVNGNGADPVEMVLTLGKTIAFLGAVIAIGHWVYPKLREPFQDRHGKVFTFLLVLALGFGLIAQAIGLHVIIGAYMAGLFFSKKIAIPELFDKVEDRLHGIAYSFLGPIFFISLGFHVTFEAISGPGFWFVLVLTGTLVVGQIASAGGMARLLKMSWLESLSVGVGMCGRAEMAFVLSSLGLTLGILDAYVFSVLIFSAFLLNLFTPLGLLACVAAIKRRGN